MRFWWYWGRTRVIFTAVIAVLILTAAGVGIAFGVRGYLTVSPVVPESSVSPVVPESSVSPVVPESSVSPLPPATAERPTPVNFDSLAPEFLVETPEYARVYPFRLPGAQDTDVSVYVFHPAPATIAELSEFYQRALLARAMRLRESPGASAAEVRFTLSSLTGMRYLGELHLFVVPDGVVLAGVLTPDL